MAQAFSRSSLHIIILACIGVIAWISIHQGREPAGEHEIDLELTPLSALHHQHWRSQEGVDVYWQSRLDSVYRLRLLGRQSSDLDGPLRPDEIGPSSGRWQWQLDLGAELKTGLVQLKQALAEHGELTGRGALIILQGPWSAELARITAARVITDLKLRPLPIGERLRPVMKRDVQSWQCPWQPVSARYWLADQLSQYAQWVPLTLQRRWRLSVTTADVEHWPQLPQDEGSLGIWKRAFINRWQQSWDTPVRQFDMLTELAYYRLPNNYLSQGYWGINRLDLAELNDYLNACQSSSTANPPHLESS